jgi:hypothetical protein
MSSELGKALIVAGILLVAIGLLLTFGGRLNFIGKLPGDLHIERENYSFFFPLGTCLLISLLLSLIIWIFRR